VKLQLSIDHEALGWDLVRNRPWWPVVIRVLLDPNRNAMGLQFARAQRLPALPYVCIARGVRFAGPLAPAFGASKRHSADASKDAPQGEPRVYRSGGSNLVGNIREINGFRRGWRREGGCPQFSKKPCGTTGWLAANLDMCTSLMYICREARPLRWMIIRMRRRWEAGQRQDFVEATGQSGSGSETRSRSRDHDL
jgi:hypothetical protein